jgi:hypothetical protein
MCDAQSHLIDNAGFQHPIIVTRISTQVRLPLTRSYT